MVKCFVIVSNSRGQVSSVYFVADDTKRDTIRFSLLFYQGPSLLGFADRERRPWVSQRRRRQSRWSGAWREPSTQPADLRGTTAQARRQSRLWSVSDTFSLYRLYLTLYSKLPTIRRIDHQEFHCYPILPIISAMAENKQSLIHKYVETN